MVFSEVAEFCEDADSEGGKNTLPIIFSNLPQRVYAVYNLGHIFAIIHVRCLRVEYLKEEKNTGKSLLSHHQYFSPLQSKHSYEVFSQNVKSTYLNIYWQYD